MEQASVATQTWPGRRWAAVTWLVATIVPVSAHGTCASHFKPPAQAPLQATDYNGIQLQDVCIDRKGPYTVHVIGDWGGITYTPHMPPIPADKRSKLFPGFHREFINGVDDRAQLRVAEQMRLRAAQNPPDYILNAGDNFYWGGIAAKCGGAPFQNYATGQWLNIFENVYWGEGLEGKPWLGCLGNHDYGGYRFTSAWDQVIGYSWGGPHSTGRWLTPAQYWGQKVIYPDFSVDLLFIDTNVFEAWTPEMNPTHNICGIDHNGKDATCGPQGPVDVWTCESWFADLWEQQMRWMEYRLTTSSADFQVIVTHFPPKWGGNDWACLADRYGIDLFISGHMHEQQVFAPGAPQNILGQTCVIISGGGGGITAESPPDLYGADDAYGFFHLTLSKDSINLEAISHGGVVRSVTECPKRPANQGGLCAAKVPEPTHFEAADGGVDRACRGQDSSDDSGKNFNLLVNVPSMKACQRHCYNTAGCTGVAFGDKVCEVWTSDITATAAVPGFFCMRLLPGPQVDGQDLEASATKGGAAASQELADRKLGRNRACRGRNDDDLSDEYFKRQNSTPSLAGCERICLNSNTCTGVEYGPGHSCKTWVEPIRATVAQKGVVCVPRHADDASIAEVSAQLHI